MHRSAVVVVADKTSLKRPFMFANVVHMVWRRRLGAGGGAGGVFFSKSDPNMVEALLDRLHVLSRSHCFIRAVTAAKMTREGMGVEGASV